MVLIDHAEPDDPDDPWRDWFGIARAYLPDREPPYLGGPRDADQDDDEAHAWIDAVVGAMAKKPLNAANLYREALS